MSTNNTTPDLSNLSNLTQSAQMAAPTVEGFLVWSNRGMGEPSNISAAALEAALVKVGGEALKQFLPPVTGIGAAMINAVSRTRAAAAKHNCEWRECAEKDAAGNRVMLLQTISADAATLTSAAQAHGAVLIDAQGAATLVCQSNVLDHHVMCADFVAAYKKELGVMGSTQLWNTAQTIAMRDGDGFKVSPGQFFVSGKSADELLVFDAALASIGSHYRLRRMKFDPVSGANVAEDATTFINQQYEALVEQYKNLKDSRTARNQIIGEAVDDDYGVKAASIAQQMELLVAMMKVDVSRFEEMQKDMTLMMLESFNARVARG